MNQVHNQLLITRSCQEMWYVVIMTMHMMILHLLTTTRTQMSTWYRVLLVTCADSKVIEGLKSQTRQQTSACKGKDHVSCPQRMINTEQRYSQLR